MYEVWESTYRFLSEQPLLGSPLLQWVLFLIFAAVFYIVFRIAVGIVTSRVKAFAEQTETPYDDYVVGVLERTRWYGLLGVAVFLAVYVAKLGEADNALRSLALVLVFLQVGVWGNGLIKVILEKAFQAARVSEATAQTSAGVVRWFALVLLWGCIFLLILTAFNIEVTPLIAGLGVGGIAIGFALQQILGDIFCSVALVLDRPFEVGDFIILGDYMGSVEQIGIKTTRIRSLSGEQIIIPNSDLLGSRVRNYKRMQERRIVFGFGVLYSTPVDKLEQIPEMVKEVINGINESGTDKKTRFDRAHFQAFGDSALQFEVVYYVLSPDFNLYMDIQQKINLGLMSRFQAFGIDMAFPSRTLYFDRASTAPLFNGMEQRQTSEKQG
jgi:small-conductance mechanosensitive channel